MVDLFVVVIIFGAAALFWVDFARGGIQPPRMTRTTRSFGWIIQVLIGGMIVVFFLGIIFTMIRLFFLQNN